jgi:hypothetical protein
MKTRHNLIFAAAFLAALVAKGQITPLKTSTGAPGVAIISPNGGEMYAPGTKTLTWKTKNLPKNAITTICISDERTYEWDTRCYQHGDPIQFASLLSVNDSESVFEYTFVIPESFDSTLPAYFKGIYGGKHYKMFVNVQDPSGKIVYDKSDSNFTITKKDVAVHILNYKGMVYKVEKEKVTVRAEWGNGIRTYDILNFTDPDGHLVSAFFEQRINARTNGIEYYEIPLPLPNPYEWLYNDKQIVGESNFKFTWINGKTGTTRYCEYNCDKEKWKPVK